MRASSVVDVVLGEATFRGGPEARYEDMRAIASVIANRARALGVTPEQVVQKTSEFNAYGKALPQGVNAYRDLAVRALADVMQNGPVHNATFYATPEAKHNLPKGLKEVTRTKGHVYFTDPQERAINTAVGTRPANYDAITRAPLASVASVQADRRLADAWGYSDPNTTLGLTTPANTPMPGGLLADPRAMRDISAGLLGGVAAPTARPAGLGRAPAAPTPRNTNIGRPGVPTPMSRPTPSMAAPSVMSASVQERMTGIPMSDRQITASIPDLPAASAMLSRTAPGINAQPPMDRPAQAPNVADLPASVMERMGGFPSAPAQAAAPAPAAPSRGLLGMSAQAATMPGAQMNGLLGTSPTAPRGQMPSTPDIRMTDEQIAAAIDRMTPAAPTPAPTNFAGTMGSPRAAGVPDFAPPASYQAPPASYQTPAFSTAPPMIDALGQPPVPGLQRAPQAPVQQQPAAPAPQVPSMPAPRTVAPAPTIAGPIGQQRATPAAPRTQSNITAPPANEEAARVAAQAALNSVANRPSPGLFGGTFAGPTGVMGGALLGGTLAGLPGMALGGLLGSQTVRDKIGLGNLGGGFGTGQLSAGALSALNAGWGGFGNMNPTQQMAVGLAQNASMNGGDGFGTGTLSREARDALDAGWSGFGNMPGSSRGGNGGFGSGTRSEAASRAAESSMGGLW
jgi:hypothetical protein